MITGSREMTRLSSWGEVFGLLQISKTFALPLDKDVVRRILACHYQPDRPGGPSWLAFIGHMKDSLWSIDFFSV